MGEISVVAGGILGVGASKKISDSPVSEIHEALSKSQCTNEVDPLSLGGLRNALLAREMRNILVPSTREAQRAELHKSIWRVANDLRGSVDGWDFHGTMDTSAPKPWLSRMTGSSRVDYPGCERRKH